MQAGLVQAASITRPSVPVRIQVGRWQELGKLATEVRSEVFVREQRIPLEIELDGQDDTCIHVVAVAQDSGVPVGTARLFPDGHVGRMAVLWDWRGRGIGRLIMERLIAFGRANGYEQLVLQSQVHASDFYRKLGFSALADPPEIVLVAGIPHVEMRCRLTK